MFTGIIQAVGVIELLEPRGDALCMRVSAAGFFAGNRVGDSVANDGVCLTIEDCARDWAQFTLIRQTVNTTAFQNRRPGSRVNLEQACRADSLLGGHFVMGHVDGTARVAQVVERAVGREIELELPPDLMRYVIQKGSIALNGISLTVAERRERLIRVALIPETLAKTNTADWRVGDLVNVEVDMLGKYVENFLRQADLTSVVK